MPPTDQNPPAPPVALPSLSHNIAVVSTGNTARFHPYQRENSHHVTAKNDTRIDPRLARKQGPNGGKEKPKDPRLSLQTPQQTAPRLPPASNQVNTNRDPRQRR